MSTKIYNGLIFYPEKIDDLEYLKNKILNKLHKSYQYKLIETINKMYSIFAASIIKTQNFNISLKDALIRSFDIDIYKFKDNEKYINDFVNEERFYINFDSILKNANYENKNSDAFYNLIVLQILTNYTTKILVDKHFGKINTNGSFIFSEFDMSVFLFPYKNKILLYVPDYSYYKNKKEHCLFKDIKNIKGVKDYHYQDQTDKPANISKKSWEKRDKTWQKVLSYKKQNSYDINNGLKLSIDNILSTKNFRINLFENINFLNKIVNEICIDKITKKIKNDYRDKKIFESLDLVNMETHQIINKVIESKEFYKNFTKMPDKSILNIKKSFNFYVNA